MNQANEYPYCPTTSLVLVLSNGRRQRKIGDGRWENTNYFAEPLRLHGIEKISQGINEIGWLFTVKFADGFTNSIIARSKTGWKIDGEDRSILHADSAVDYAHNKREVILVTELEDDFRILWPDWTIEMVTRAPKWRSEAERQADMAAHERVLPSTTRLPIGVGNDFSARRVALDGCEETFLQKEENRKR